MNFKTLRVSLLLLTLVYVGFDTLLSNARATDWKHPLRVVIYPINGDGSAASKTMISTLNNEQFEDIILRIKEDSSHYGLSLSTPIQIQLANELKSYPPVLPKDRNTLSIMWWSLKLRYWSWKEDNFTGIKPQIRAYALFFDPKNTKGLYIQPG